MSKEQLIELVMQLDAVIEQLRRRVAELEAQLSKPKKTPANSSIPPSQGYKENVKSEEKERKKRGPKEGHAGKSRCFAEADVKLECKVERCDRCGEDLSEGEQRFVERRQVIELPVVKPIVVEAEVFEVVCPACGQVHRSEFPAGFTAPFVFGDRVCGLVSYFHEVHHLPYLRLKGVMKEAFGLEMGLGSLVNLVRRTGESLEGEAEEIRREVVSSEVVGCDETGARVKRTNGNGFSGRKRRITM